MAHPLHSMASPPPWLADPGMGLRLGEAAEVCGSLVHSVIGPGEIAGERICNDSRILQPGDIFVALSSEKRDGHLFVVDALERGACFAIVSQWPLPADLHDDQGVLVVRDVDAALVK